jgi:hypothetical protein
MASGDVRAQVSGTWAAPQYESRLSVATSVAGAGRHDGRFANRLASIRADSSSRTRLRTASGEILKFFFEAKSGVPDAAFVPAAQGTSTVKRGSMRTGKRHVQMQEMSILPTYLQFRRGAEKVAARRETHASACPRAAEFVALPHVSDGAPHTFP